MKTARELYEEKRWYGDYQLMLNEFGTVLLQVRDNDYQGDTRILYRQTPAKHGQNRYGWLQFGWGSCSGCDRLQSCKTIEEVQNLMDELYASIQWWNTKPQVRHFFQTHDWEGDYSWHREEQRLFVEKVIALMST